MEERIRQERQAFRVGAKHYSEAREMLRPYPFHANHVPFAAHAIPKSRKHSEVGTPFSSQPICR